MTTLDPNLIHYGDTITATSEVTITSLGRDITKDYEAYITVVFMSRDGSRRIVRAEAMEVVNANLATSFATRPLTFDYVQRWEGVRNTALHLAQPGQTPILWNGARHRRTAPKMREMVGLYVPYGAATKTSELSTTPVNPLLRCGELKETLAITAHGWDQGWMGRYMFSNHLRQQVTGRVVDGLLAYAWARINYFINGYNRLTFATDILLIERDVKLVCDICEGDTSLRSRQVARNLDLLAFQLRLNLGEVPKPITTSIPWQPGAPVAKANLDGITNVNERNEVSARWHDRNRQLVEDNILRYYDVDMQVAPEETYGYTTDHIHPSP